MKARQIAVTVPFEVAIELHPSRSAVSLSFPHNPKALTCRLVCLEPNTIAHHFDNRSRNGSHALHESAQINSHNLAASHAIRSTILPF